MPVDCPHDRCRFFLWDPDAACPACGRHRVLTPVGLARYRRRVAATALAGLLAAAVALWILRGVWLLAALVFVGAAVALLVRAGPAAAALPAAATLDTRYDDAVATADHWLERWRDLYRGGGTELADDEALLLREARDLAAEAAAEAVVRCRALGDRYVRNALDRLDHTLDALGHGTSCDPAGRVRLACALVERTLDERWVDEPVASAARRRLHVAEQQVRRAGIAALTARATFLPEPVFAAAADLDPVDLERRRLRVERELFLEIPQA